MGSNVTVEGFDHVNDSCQSVAGLGFKEDGVSRRDKGRIRQAEDCKLGGQLQRVELAFPLR